MKHLLSTLLFCSCISTAVAETGASIRVGCSTHFNVTPLKKGQIRLYDSNPVRVIEDFQPDLQSFQFMSIPQRLEVKLNVQVDTAGKILALFGGNDRTPVPAGRVFFKEQPSRWKLVNGAIKGKNIIACYETQVQAGEKLSLEGFELQLAAGNIQIVEAASSNKTLSSIQTDANQPRISVIKDQGPNATEWALTPLDEAIPADIRQNLTFLREDLLDEGKKATKASPEAYKMASDYCDRILTALDQRDLARVNAGYAAAQADANKATSTQALDVRRNHQMSWPQFSREESQRAALRENETDKADVKKERLKVEWTKRSLQMRSYLDDLYRQLREALR
jgi:hypothetical protein